MKKNRLLLFSAITALSLILGCKKIDKPASDEVVKKAPGHSKANISIQSFSGVFTNSQPGSSADPWVIRAGGFYWYCGSDAGAIWIKKSTGLHNIVAQPATYIFWGNNNNYYSNNIWAPELHYRGGRWYVYFAADDGYNINHRMYCLEGGTDINDPLNGTYSYKSKLSPTTDRWAIDGHPFDFQGQSYFVWSGWEGTTNVSQRLYIARMSNPYTLTGERVEISRPDYAWEQVGSPTVNEGPTTLISGGTVNIIYSASGSWTDSYCLGRISNHPGTTNLMTKASWGKLPNPVFKSYGNIYGPGHASFTVSPDGIQPWIVYHSAVSSGAGWDRAINIQQYHWEYDIPYFGTPIEKGVKIPAPSVGYSYHSPIANGTYKLRNRYSGKALHAPNSSAGAQIVQWTDNGSVNQKWIFTAIGDGYYEIKSAMNGLCLDNSGASYNAGNPIVQWNDTNHFCQRWRVQDMGNGCFQLTNRFSLFNLDNPNSSTADGTGMQQWHVNNADAEQWYIWPPEQYPN